MIVGLYGVSLCLLMPSVLCMVASVNSVNRFLLTVYRHLIALSYHNRTLMTVVIYIIKTKTGSKQTIVVIILTGSLLVIHDP